MQVVAKDVETQQQFLAHFVGGEKAKLSWFVQLIAEQLAWAEAEHVSICIKDSPELYLTEQVWRKYYLGIIIMTCMASMQRILPVQIVPKVA